MEYLQPDDVVQTTHVHVLVKDLIQTRVVLRFHSDALGQCTIMVVSTLEVKTYANSDFPYGQR